MAKWSIKGNYMETCNCTFLCPCPTSHLTAIPTEGDCKVAIAMKIDNGNKDGVTLDGLSFIVLLHAPTAMGEGNITVGLIIDQVASDAQAQAIGDIVTGAAGGPMEALGPLVGKVAGIERRPIKFESDGLKWSVTAGDLISQSCEAVLGGDGKTPMYIDNVVHPIGPRVAMAKATNSSFHAFGIDWEDSSGTRNGHFAPFSWSA